jgi:hypothetical protein
VKQEDNVKRQLLFERWKELAFKVESFSAIVQNDLVEFPIDKYQVREFDQATDEAQRTLTFLSNETYKFVKPFVQDEH